MKKLCGVYVIRSISTDRFYYGSSEDCRKRKQGHLRALRRGDHHSIFLQRVFNKYGEGDFRFTFLIRCKTREEAFGVEQNLLNQYVGKKGCMNISMGAGGGDNLTHNPNRKSIIAKMTRAVQSRIDAMTDLERQEAFSRPGELNGMFGKTHSRKTRKRLAEVNSVPKPYLRKPKSDEGIVNMKIAARKRVRDPNYVNSFANKTHSAETLKVLSDIAYARVAAGILPSNTRRVKIGTKKYRSLSEAARQIGVVPATVLNRIRSDNYPDYSYID